jgi:hypothetical protein
MRCSPEHLLPPLGPGGVGIRHQAGVHAQRDIHPAVPELPADGARQANLRKLNDRE